MPLYVKPFIQIVEDVMLEMRESSTEESVKRKYKRRVNDIYTKDIPSRFEWDWLRKTGTIVLSASYNTGTVSVTKGSSTIIGSGTNWTSSHTGMKFTIPSTHEIYTFTYVSSTQGSITPSYMGNTASGLSYLLFQDTYTLANDFSRPTNEPGFYYDYSQGRQRLKWVDDYNWYRYYTTQPADFPVYWRECPDKTSLGLYQVQFMPPVNTSRIISYEYIKALPEMIDFTSGTATTTAGSATVTLSSDYSSYISIGQYFRVDDDGTWKKIISISGNTLTLDSVYPSSNTNKNYTICDAPDMPYQFQEALFYGACYLSALEQGENVQGYLMAYLRALDLDMARRARKRFGRQYMRHYTHILGRY